LAANDAGAIVVGIRPPKKYGYAGTPDILFKAGNGYFYIDEKTGADQPSWRIQGAAYCQLFEEAGFGLARKIGRGSLILREGEFDFRIYDERFHAIEFNHFLSALNCYKWRQENNLLGGRNGFNNPEGN
jgi:hypothetical protein